MEWKKFLLFNALGAITWVSAIAAVGYAFADEFQTLLGFFEKASWILALAVFSVGYYIWRRKKKRFEEKAQQQNAA